MRGYYFQLIAFIRVFKVKLGFVRVVNTNIPCIIRVGKDTNTHGILYELSGWLPKGHSWR